MGKTQAPVAVKRSQSDTAEYPQTPAIVKKSMSDHSKCSTFVKKTSCRLCKGCKRENCGKCISCLSMMAFGGAGRKKSKCLVRVCENMQLMNCVTPQKYPLNSLKIKLGNQNSARVNLCGKKTSPNVQPGDQNSPRVKPGDKNSPRVKPGDQNSLRVKPGGQNSPRVKLGDQNSPKVKPGNQNSPRVKPGDQNSPRIKRGDQNSPGVKRGGQNSSRVKPGSQNSPRVKLGGHSSPRVKSSDQNSHRIKLGSQNSPRVKSGDQNSPRVKSGNQNSPRIKPRSLNSPRVKPGGQNSPRVKPGSQNSPRVKSCSQNSPRVKQGSQNSPRVKQCSQNSPRVKQGSQNSPRVKQCSQNSPRVKSGDQNSPRVKSGNQNSPRVKPGSQNSPRVKSGDQNSPRVKPGSQNSPRVKSGDQNSPRAKSTGKNRARIQLGSQNSPSLKSNRSSVSPRGNTATPSRLQSDTSTQKEISLSVQIDDANPEPNIDEIKVLQQNRRTKCVGTNVETVKTSTVVDKTAKKPLDDPRIPMQSSRIKACASTLKIQITPKHKVGPQQSPRIKAQTGVTVLVTPKNKTENKTPQSSPRFKSDSSKKLKYSPKKIKIVETAVVQDKRKPNVSFVTVKSASGQAQEHEKSRTIIEATKVSDPNSTRQASINPIEHFYQTKTVGSQKVSTRRKTNENSFQPTSIAEKMTTQDTEDTNVKENRPKDSIPKDVDQVPVGDGSSSSERATTVLEKTDIDLPTIELDSMTKAELKEFIPLLLKLVTGKEEVFYSRRSAKPEWWPGDVAWAASLAAWISETYWTDSLKSVVKNCYKHVGKEELLHSFVDSHLDLRSSESLGKQCIDEDSVKTGSYPSSPVKIRMFPGSYPASPVKIRMFPPDLFLPFSAEIYICVFCEKEFLSKEKMRTHQKDCNERPPDLQQVYAGTSPRKFQPEILPPTTSPKRSIGNWSKLSLDKFVGHLDLVPKLTAAKLRENRPSLEEVNCEILDDIEPMSPVTPKTPKSLISQLSRDESGHASRKRLSYSLSMDSHKDDVTIDTDLDSESEAEMQTKQVHEMNLLDIPISSWLGQRIKKYVHVNTPLCIVEDSNSFCRTPVKNTFLEKLRKKPLAYPITYRPRRIANMHTHVHVYRFTKSEIKEFLCRMETGLSLSSMEKLRKMKKFNIRLLRLSRKRLLEWIPRRKLDKQLRGAFKGLKSAPYNYVDDIACEFPSGPTLLAKNIDKLLGLKKRSSQKSSRMLIKNSLSLSNFISEEMEAEVSKQKLTLYRSLLYEMSVLKPAVVMEDIGSRVRTGKVDTECTSVKRTNMTDVDNRVEMKEQEVKPGSVFRHMIHKSREERLIAEVEERERKDEYQTLKALLLAPKTLEKPTITVRDEKTSPLLSAISGMKGEKKSPNDDSLSIVSASSEDDSLQSNCCQGCSDKKHHVNSPVPGVKHTIVDQGPTSNEQSDSTPFIEPLHVEVDLDFTPKMDEYGIPSPVSISSESPFPPTPSKSSTDSFEEANQPRETRSTRSSSQSSPIKVFSVCKPVIDKPVFSLMSSKDTRMMSNVAEKLVKTSLHRFQSEGIKTRSCSGTPNGSPVKRLTRSVSSVPVSPNKATRLTKLPLDVKQVSKRLESRGVIQSSPADVQLNFRSGGSSSDLRRCRSTSKLRSVLTASDLGKGGSTQTLGLPDSPQKSGNATLYQLNTVSSKPNSGSIAANVVGQSKVVNYLSLASPQKRSKRMTFMPQDGIVPTKVRKVYSDRVINP